MTGRNPISYCFIKTSHVYDLLHGKSPGGTECNIVRLAWEFKNRAHHVPIITGIHSGKVEFHEGITLIDAPKTYDPRVGVLEKGFEYLRSYANFDADILYVRGRQANALTSKPAYRPDSFLIAGAGCPMWPFERESLHSLERASFVYSTKPARFTL